MNVDFLKKVLMSEAEYWVVAKRDEYSKVKIPDYICLICVPSEIKTGLKYEEITLKALEDLSRSEYPNIYLNTGCPPFQKYQRFGKLFEGFPVEKNIKEFLSKALLLESDELYEYEKLLKD